jgi:hypothetical protein
MSSRSQSSAYKSALTNRFTHPRKRKHLDLHNVQMFKHRPLRDPKSYLRHLYLLPRRCNIDVDGQTVLRCELMSRPIKRAPPYIGLSYTWGDPKLRRPVAIGERVLHITESLAIALENLQEEEKTLVLWVDAVCIDQENQTEKNIQVQQMGVIFTSAVLVIAWLGISADESDLALQELKKYLDITSLSAAKLKESDGQIFDALPIDPIKALFGRPWFKRVWVGQEVALNKQVMFVCGQRDITRSNLLNAYILFAASMYLWKEFWELPCHSRFSRLERLPLRDFIGNISGSFHLMCGTQLESSDPKDFVYSLFGKINNIEETGLRVDYSKSVEEVYTDFAEAIVQAGRVYWLSRCWRPSSKYKTLPSWVPDWSNTSPYLFPSKVKYPGPAAKICVADGGHRVLKISVQRIDRINRIEYSLHEPTYESSPLRSALFPQQQEKEALHFLDLLQQMISSKMKSHEPQEADKAACEMSIAMSPAHSYKIAPEKDVLYNSYRAFRGLVSPPEDTHDPQAWRQDASRYYINAFQASNFKQLFVTSTDLVGLGRDDVQPGDWLCILGGLCGLWVLREAREGCYHLVSFSHIFGTNDFSDIDTTFEVLNIF